MGRKLHALNFVTPRFYILGHNDVAARNKSFLERRGGANRSDQYVEGLGGVDLGDEVARDTSSICT